MSSLTFNKLRRANVKRGKEWNATVWGEYENVLPTENSIEWLLELLFRSNEMGGECGEAQNKIKKLSRYLLRMRGGTQKEDVIEEIKKELADVVICADRVAEFLNIDLGKATIEKFNETSDKHGFDIKLK